jgi:hypothetical protein
MGEATEKREGCWDSSSMEMLAAWEEASGFRLLVGMEGTVLKILKRFLQKAARENQEHTFPHRAFEKHGTRPYQHDGLRIGCMSKGAGKMVK